MNLFERLFGKDQSAIAETENLFGQISKGMRGDLAQRHHVQLLIERIKKKYHLYDRVKNNPAGLIADFHPNNKIAVEQIEIFLGEPIFSEPMRTSSPEDVFANIVAIFILAAGLRSYGIRQKVAKETPPVRT